MDIELNRIANNTMDWPYDPHGRMSFFFKINDIEIRMNNPFTSRFQPSQSEDKDLNEFFKNQFGNPKIFVSNLLEQMNSSSIRYVIDSELIGIDSNDYTEAFCG